MIAATIWLMRKVLALQKEKNKIKLEVISVQAGAANVMVDQHMDATT